MEENEHAVVDTNSREDTGNPTSKQFRITNAVELPLFLMMISSAMGGAAISNLILYRTCVNSLNHPADECRPFLSPDKANLPTILEQEVQEYANMVNTVSTVLGSLVPAVLSLFIGAWSDRHGRKPLLMWSLLGMTFNAMVLVIYSMAPGFGPWWLVVTGTFFSLFGGFSITVIGTLCYITDVTDVDNRTRRLVMVQMIFAVGMTAGGMASAYVLRAVGDVYLFLISAALQTCAYAFTAVVLEESLTGIETGSILTVLDLSHIKEIVRDCFKERPHHGRPKLLLIIAATALTTFTMYGGSGLMYLYTRNKLQWTMKDYTTYSGISTVWVMGGFAAVAVFQKLFDISDLTFAAIAMLSCIGDNIIKAAATTSWDMYMSSIVSFFGSVAGPLNRSYLSKTLSSHDIAKAYGLLGSAESFCPLLAPLVYNALYEFTLSKFPGAFLVLTACICTVSLFFIITVKYLITRSPTVDYHLIEDDGSVN